MKQIKLIAGAMNIPYIVCKPGYADGVLKPKRVIKHKEKTIQIKVRRQEGLYV